MVGLVLELNTGETSVIKQINHNVAGGCGPVKSTENTLLSKPYELDLCGQIETPNRSITPILEPHQAGIDSTLYLDKKVV